MGGRAAKGIVHVEDSSLQEYGPPAYQADPAKPAAYAYTAARGPDLNGDLPDSDIRLPGAPRHHHATAPSAASFPRNSTRGSLMVPDMPPQMELLPRLPRQPTVAANEVKAEAAAARAAARVASERVMSCNAAVAEREDEGRQGAAAALSDEDEATRVSPGEESSLGRPSSASAPAAPGWSTSEAPTKTGG